MGISALRCGYIVVTYFRVQGVRNRLKKRLWPQEDRDAQGASDLIVVIVADAVATAVVVAVDVVVVAAARGEVKPNANAKKTQIPQSSARFACR
jgi:hypothetical protein